METKGSLTLKSDHMNYGSAVLVSKWDQSREAEPKDYYLNRAPVRNIKHATYHRLGNVTDGSLPESTYQDFSKDILRRKDPVDRADKKHMFNKETYFPIDTDIYGRARINPDADKFYSETTYIAAYGAPYPILPSWYTEKPEPDYTNAYKKCVSQFADSDSHRRAGRNTWQDESGFYANSLHKAQCPQYQTRPDLLTKAFEGTDMAHNEKGCVAGDEKKCRHCNYGLSKK